MKTSVPTACPCGSGRAYAQCCGPCHDGKQPAATAEALMRSRYSAYVLGRHDYLLASWHPDTRPAELDGMDRCKWLRLAIAECTQGGEHDATGTVRFAAWFTVNGRAHRMDELSSFERVDGRWVYRDGVPPEAGAAG